MGLFEKGAFNALVIRLDGQLAIRGLTVAPVFAGYFDEVRMERPWQMTAREPSDLEMKADECGSRSIGSIPTRRA